MKKYALKTTSLFIFVQIIIFIGTYIIYTKMENSPLLVFMIFLVAMEIGLVLLLYYLFNKKNNDIEISKSKYLGAKPYMIEVNRFGKIKSYNETCKRNLKNIGKLKGVHDFISGEVIFEDLQLQKPFIAGFEDGKKKIRFQPLKTSGGYLLVGEDVTDSAESAEYYRKLAMGNLVTGLPNKNFLMKRLENLFSDKEDLEKKNSLVELNLQDFKRINRLFGVKFGDECLLKMTEILKRSLQGFKAEIFHLHADDFIILFMDLANYQQVISWADRILKFLEKAISVAGTLIIFETKMGIFHLESDIYPNLNHAAAIENVALALKKAKESRRTNYIVYDMGLGQHFTRLQAMENDLLHALQNNELTMYYQPQVFNNRRKVYGLEALIRWKNPKYFHESPIHFIRLAEENNLIVDLGRFVINETFRFAKELEPYNVRISINVSPVQLLQPGFVKDIENAFLKYNLKEKAISLEITETFLMESYDLIIDKLVNLKKLGISIHLDNFGSEYSSLAYLKDLPVDSISIGHAFVKDIQTDRTTRAIVSKLISLAESLELEVIAEGVEEEKQNRFLMENGCRIVQGFLISKPLPKNDAMKFITDYDYKLPILEDLR